MIRSLIGVPGIHSPWGLWTVLLTAAAFGLWLERTRWRARLSGAVITLASTFLLSNLGIIPASAPTYDTVWSTMVPLAIPLLLFKADLRRVLRESGPTLTAYAIGAAGTLLGTWAAFHVFPLGEHGWQLAAIFSATYIGGSMNYMGTAEAVGLHSGDLLTAGIAADNLMMTVYFLVLFTLPSLASVQRRFATANPWNASAHVGANPKPPLDLAPLAAALALSAGICSIAYALEAQIGWRGSAILILTAVTVAIATLLPRPMAKLRGADEMGMLLMQVFFAAIGASANIAHVWKVAPLLFLFAALILTIHLIFLLTCGKLLGLSLPELLIASNANMGGPTTAAAMAAARRWDALVIPAILCGTLGYAIATFLGVLLGNLLR